jgi:hypothetical protein
MVHARVHDSFEDIGVADSTDFVFIAVFVLEVFPFQTAQVFRFSGSAGNFPVLEIQGTLGLDGTFFPD